MNPPSLHPTPPFKTVLREQLRVVALALRVPVSVAALLVGLATIINVADFLRGHGGVEFAPELSMIPGAVGALLPIGIWQREERRGDGFFWSMPVDRRRHALTKVCAGWMCLMASVVVFTLWWLALSAFTGGDIHAPERVSMLPTMTLPEARSMSDVDLHTLNWMPPAILWLVPFTASSGTYLLASAFALGSRFPLRWMIGISFSALLASASGAAVHAEWLKRAPSRVVEVVHEGRYGLDALLSARTESLKTAIVLKSGETVVVWRGLPDVSDWIVATLLWFGIGAIALWAASARHRERKGKAHFTSEL